MIVSLLFSLAASLMIYRLLHLVLPSETALFSVVLFSVVLFCVAPLSPLLQGAYAESIFLFLLALALYLLVKGRYALLFPVVAVMALTRPSGLAFACALGLHLVHRWWVRRREPFPVSEALRGIALATFSLLLGFAWSIAAWVGPDLFPRTPIQSSSGVTSLSEGVLSCRLRRGFRARNSGAANGVLAPSPS